MTNFIGWIWVIVYIYELATIKYNDSEGDNSILQCVLGRVKNGGTD